MKGAAAVRDVAVIGFAEAPNVRRTHGTTNGVEMLVPIFRQVFDQTGLTRADIGFWCSGSSDYLAGLMDGLQAAGFLSGASTFGIYMNANDGPFLAPTINGAIRDNLPITTVWYAAYLPHKNLECVALPYSEGHDALSSGEIDVTAEIWQYAENCHAHGIPYKDAGFDMSSMAPPVRLSSE